MVHSFDDLLKPVHTFTVTEKVQYAKFSMKPVPFPDRLPGSPDAGRQETANPCVARVWDGALDKK